MTGFCQLGVEGGFAQWRAAARELLAAGVAPATVQWLDGAASLPFASLHMPAAAAAEPMPHRLETGATMHRVPAEFLGLAEQVACHRDADRWNLLYRVLWRLTHGEPRLLRVCVDDDVLRLATLQRQVRFDAHKMKAFVRFRRTVDSEGNETYVAWHRPAHRVLPLTASFFARRFPNMRWAILTPDESVAWDGAALRWGPASVRSAAPQPDELEALWRTYYANIFNPARVKLGAMLKEMPRRYWDTMPETDLIADLIAAAGDRVEQMSRERSVDWPTAAAYLPVERSLPVLREAAAGCAGCPLREHATVTVFGRGPADARVVFVGEQPGDAEDRAGEPFVGPAGQLLDEILGEVGIDRSRVYVTNAVKHFKFEQRGKRRIHARPGVREIQACRPWLMAELAAIRPALVVCLGATAAQSLLGRDFRVTANHGRIVRSPEGYAVMATIHPSAVLRAPDDSRRAAMRREMVEDLQGIQNGQWPIANV